jgi:hypothetical protein
LEQATATEEVEAAGVKLYQGFRESEASSVCFKRLHIFAFDFSAQSSILDHQPQTIYFFEV